MAWALATPAPKLYIPLPEVAGISAPARNSVLKVAALNVPSVRGLACLSIRQPEGGELTGALAKPAKLSTVGSSMGMATGLSKTNELVADAPPSDASPTRRTATRT